MRTQREMSRLRDAVLGLDDEVWRGTCAPLFFVLAPCMLPTIAGLHVRRMLSYCTEGRLIRERLDFYAVLLYRLESHALPSSPTHVHQLQRLLAAVELIAESGAPYSFKKDFVFDLYDLDEKTLLALMELVGWDRGMAR